MYRRCLARAVAALTCRDRCSRRPPFIRKGALGPPSAASISRRWLSREQVTRQPLYARMFPFAERVVLIDLDPKASVAVNTARLAPSEAPRQRAWSSGSGSPSAIQAPGSCVWTSSLMARDAGKRTRGDNHNRWLLRCGSRAYGPLRAGPRVGSWVQTDRQNGEV